MKYNVISRFQKLVDMSDEAYYILTDLIGNLKVMPMSAHFAPNVFYDKEKTGKLNCYYDAVECVVSHDGITGVLYVLFKKNEKKKWFDVASVCFNNDLGISYYYDFSLTEEIDGVSVLNVSHESYDNEALEYLTFNNTDKRILPTYQEFRDYGFKPDYECSEPFCNSGLFESYIVNSYNEFFASVYKNNHNYSRVNKVK